MIDLCHPLAVLATRMLWVRPPWPCDATRSGVSAARSARLGRNEGLKVTINAAVRPAEFERVIVSTTVQEKAIACPTDSRLLVIARHRVAKAARSYTTLYYLKGRYPLALRSCESRATSQPLSTCPLLPGTQKR